MAHSYSESVVSKPDTPVRPENFLSPVEVDQLISQLNKRQRRFSKGRVKSFRDISPRVLTDQELRQLANLIAARQNTPVS